MAMKVEHELHQRRRGKNHGVFLLLVGMVAIVFGLTVVKVLNLDDVRQFERFDHVARPQLEPGAMEAAEARAEALEAEAQATSGTEVSE